MPSKPVQKDDKVPATKTATNTATNTTTKDNKPGSDSENSTYYGQ